MSSTPRYRDARIGACRSASIERRRDGSVVLRSPVELGEFPGTLTRAGPLGRGCPGPDVVAKRVEAATGNASATRRCAATHAPVGSALVARGLSPERPIAILSENDLEHLTLAFGAMYAGVRLPRSRCYSLVSQDFGKLRHILATLTPGLVFATNAALTARHHRDHPMPQPKSWSHAGNRRACGDSVRSAARRQPGAALDAAHARVAPDTIVKFLSRPGPPNNRRASSPTTGCFAQTSR